MQERSKVVIDTWAQCYGESWKGTINDVSFSHPAKFSKALIFRIMQHALEAGFIHPGETILDCFGGVGLGGLPAALQGLQHISVELEPRFCALATGFACGGDLAKHEACPETGEHGPHHVTGNLELWQRRYGSLSQWVQPIMLQGDSRELGNVFAGCDCLVSSPPFVDSDLRKGGSDLYFKQRTQTGRNPYAASAQSQTNTQPYGTTPGQLGNLPAGSVDAAIASPPYAHGLGKEHTYADHAKREKDSHRGIMREKGIADPFYGTSPAQLGNLPAGCVEAVVSSPLYGDQQVGTGGEGRTGWRGYTDHGGGGAATNGQLAAMRTSSVDGAIASPPYANGCAHTGGPDPAPQHIQGGPVHYVAYGQTAHDGDRKEEPPRTFWESAKTILEQVYALLKPGGVAMWVVKPYVRDSKIVPFPDQWRTLCEHLGFVTLHEHHALLVDSHSEMGLFGEEVTMYKRSAKSFFRRLAEKGGAPEINFEVVYCMRKPADTGKGVIDAAVASPPYVQSIHEGNGIDHTKLTGNRPGRHTQAAAEGYGTSPGQLGAMRAGDIVAVIASPPYAGAGEVLGRHNGIDYTKTAGTGQRLSPGRQMYPYGDTEGQLGRRRAGQPPERGEQQRAR